MANHRAAAAAFIMTGLAVIFDMDGVLVDSGAAHYAAWRGLGESLGIPYPESLFRKTFGMHNRQTIPMWLGRPVSRTECARLAQKKERLYRKEARATLRPIPGVVDFVRRLDRAGFRLAVGSSGPRANIRLALDLIHLTSTFKALASGDDVAAGKPDPAIFLCAARRLGVQPGRCVVVEDAPQGIEAGRRAGMKTIGITTTRSRKDLRGADLIVSRFAGLGIRRVKDVLG